MEKDLLAKIDSSFHEDLVGYVVFSNEELKEIFDYIGPQIRQFNDVRGASMNSQLDKIVFVAMVNAIKSWDCDETRFWDNICKRIVGISITQKIYIYFTDVVSRIISQGLVIGNKSYGHKYYATLCSHSLSPKKSVYSFFDLCWNIYCNDFDYTVGTDEDISFIAEQLRSHFEKHTSNNEDFSLGKNVYSLRIGIKCLAVDHPELMEKLLKEIFILVNRKFCGKTLCDITYSKYLVLLIEDWWKEYQTSWGIIKPRLDRQRGRVVSDYSRISVKYVIQDDKVILLVPPFRLRENIEYIPYVSVYDDETCLFSKALVTRGSGLMMNTRPFEISIDEYIYNGNISSLRVEIEHCGFVIYDSKKTLNRDYLLFYKNREIISQDCVPGNYILFAKDIDMFIQYPSSLRYNSGLKYVFVSNAGDVLQTVKRTVFFQEENSNHSVMKKVNVRPDVVFQNEEAEYAVIDGNLKIVIDSTVNPRSIGIRYDNSIFKLDDFSYKYQNGLMEYNVSEMINVGEPKGIVVFDFSTNKQLMVCNIVKFKNIQIVYDKPFYYDLSCSGILRFKTEKYDQSVQFTIYDEYISINLENGNLIFTPPIVRWRFDKGDWSSQFSENYWYKRIANNSRIEVSMPVGFTSIVCLSNGDYLEKISDDVYQLGEKIYSLADSDDSDMITVVCKCGTELLPLVNIITKEKVVDTSTLLLWNEKIYWNPEYNFIGDLNRKFKLKVFLFDELIQEFNLENRNAILDLVGCDSGCYKVEVYAIIGGFISRKEQLIFDTSFVMGDEKEFKYRNKKLKITQVITSKSGTAKRIKGYGIDCIKYLGMVDDIDYYSGRLFIIEPDGIKTYVSSIELSSGYSEVINPVRIEFRDDSSFWMVYGLNETDIYDFNNEFTLSASCQLTIQPDNVEIIDYYKFRIEE